MATSSDPTVSDELFPGLTGCYACGRDNPHALGVVGSVDGDEIVATWTPRPHHEGWPGLVHGGVVATLLDEVTGWAATRAFRVRDGDHDDRPVVTAEYTVRFERPVRAGDEVEIRARVVEHGDRKALVEGEVVAGSEIAATCSAVYVRLRAQPDWAASPT